jgi:hypothetical protein
MGTALPTDARQGIAVESWSTEGCVRFISDRLDVDSRKLLRNHKEQTLRRSDCKGGQQNRARAMPLTAFLLDCPKCHGWPMAFSRVIERTVRRVEASFRCRNCGYNEIVTFDLRADGELKRAREQTDSSQ